MWGAPQLTPEPPPEVSLGTLGWLAIVSILFGIFGVCVLLGFV